MRNENIELTALELLREIYDYYMTHPNYKSGMCNVLHKLEGRTFRERQGLWLEHTINYKNSRKFFYNWEGEKTSKSDQFWWKRENRVKRINWLDKQIKKLTY